MNEEYEFSAYGKTPRLAKFFSDVVITEKIDGTNASIRIEENKIQYIGSRNRKIEIGDDNFAFAHFVRSNEEEILSLGNGLHFGEWFGEGIQKNPLGIEGKRFYIFNTARPKETLPSCIGQVPVLYEGGYDEKVIGDLIKDLEEYGSRVKGSTSGVCPEGIIVYFKSLRQPAKWTFENRDGKWKKMSLGG